MSQRDKPRQGVVGNMQKLFRVRSSPHGKIDCHSGKRVFGGIRKTAFFQASRTSRRFRREVHAPGSALRKQRSLVSPPLRLELQYEGRHLQRASTAPPHAEGEELSGVTSDRETFAFISAPAGVVGGVPVTRARNPWAMPAAST
jgi:hypothetical protein